MGQTFTDDYLPFGKDNQFEEDDLYQVSVARYVPYMKEDGTIGRKLIKTKPIYASQKSLMDKVFAGIDPKRVKWQMYTPPTDEQVKKHKEKGWKEPKGAFVDSVSPSVLIEKFNAKSTA